MDHRGHGGKTKSAVDPRRWAQIKTLEPRIHANQREFKGRIEHQMFHIPNGFLQFAWLNPGDCDLHLEISDSPDKNAPRVIVETPHTDSFCSARRQLGQQLSALGFTLSSNSGELPTAVAADVLGLAFQDFNHPRGTAHVATVWELHPAIVTLK